MRLFQILIISLVFLGCSDKKQPLMGQTAWQKSQNAMFKDASKSPLTKKDLKDFEGLDFFPFDSTFVVTATLEQNPDSEWFKMKTTTDEVTEERIYGILRFNLKGKSFRLNIYQSKERIEGFEDYLFLPFLDNTNGDTTYGGGRYIDLRIQESDTIEIDFNKAYNPYCAYNEKYSCPIVPRVNYLDVKIEAGLKDYK